CWGHGDDEVFSIEQFVEWFNLDNISPSPARFDMKKLYWVNSQHIKALSNDKLLNIIKPELDNRNISINNFDINAILDLVKTRGDNLNTIINEVSYFYQPQVSGEEEIAKHLTIEAKDILDKFAEVVANIDVWSLDNIKVVIKEFCTTENVKMPQLGMPLRLKLCGTTQTPSFDAVLMILGKDEVLLRIK
ncbi:MAG: glutamate--tRNA ligase, partial [Burkholderiales bacterium]|nr:glutamate--tRNA ligase [Burkholderiales bacterium]